MTERVWKLSHMGCHACNERLDGMGILILTVVTGCRNAVFSDGVHLTTLREVVTDRSGLIILANRAGSHIM